jgi:hypothetical protein
MRRGSDLCAIRFTKFHRGEDVPGGFFTLGGPTFYAEYDWFDLTEPAVRSGQGKLSDKPGYGIPLLFPMFTGSHWVKCRSFAPLWSYPTQVRFVERNDARDYGIELAPTNWREISEINLADPRLQWYRYDENRKPVLISSEYLP